jgi:hypothetical protein
VFDFEPADCTFNYHDKIFEAEGFDLRALGKGRINGKAAYDSNSKRGSLDVDFSEIPLAAWIPLQLKPGLNSFLRGHLLWSGSVKDIADSRAAGNLNLDGTEWANPIAFEKLLGASKLRLPDYIHFDRARADFHYADKILSADYVEFRAPNIVNLDGSGYWTQDKDLQLDLAFQFADIDSWLPKKLEKHLTGNLSGGIDWLSHNGDIKHGLGSGWFKVDGAQFNSLHFQQAIARFLGDNSYLQLKMKDSLVQWKMTGHDFEIHDLQFIAPNKIGLRGNITISPNGALSGKVKIGMPSHSLTWLPEAETAVFTERSENLCWANVSVTGTVQKPKFDLSAQIMHVLARHPLKLAELGMRGLSWWLGDVLGTYESPET